MARIGIADRTLNTSGSSQWVSDSVSHFDSQHEVLRDVLGANYLAPVENPDRILEVGCGTGQWARDLCAAFPKALVVGLDTMPNTPRQPVNYRFVRSNLFEGLPFRDDRFDFVHQRFMVATVPLKSWSAVIEELVRVARPGAWIELVERGPEIEPAGPSTRQLLEMRRLIGESLALDMTGTVFESLDDYMHKAGMTNIRKHLVPVPIGEWAGRLGSLMATDCCAMFTPLCGVFESEFGLSTVECYRLIRTMQVEWEQHRSMYPFVLALGQKPDLDARAVADDG